jgi:hypothetical protein
MIRDLQIIVNPDSNDARDTSEVEAWNSMCAAPEHQHVEAMSQWPAKTQ